MKKLVAWSLSLVLILSIFVFTGGAVAEDIKTKFSGQSVTIYGRWMEDDEKWLTDNVLADFEDEYGITVYTNQYDTPTDLLSIIEMDKKAQTGALVYTTLETIPQLNNAELLIPLTDVDAKFAMADDFSDLAVSMGSVDGKQFSIASDLNCYMMMYSKSAVADALANWGPMKNDINEMIKAYNGYGLPDDYTLESDPNQWDNYDLAVVGYYWANTEINGVTAPRIAHRGKVYESTGHEIFNFIYRMGGTNDDLLTMKNQPTYDAMEWEYFFADAGIYVPAMWEEGWTGGGIYQGFANGSVYLAFMHNSDAFTVHGNDTPSMPGYLADAGDMGLALQPSGNSLEIKDGTPARTGKEHPSVTFAWGYCIPVSTPNVELSYELYKWMMKDEYMVHWASVGRTPTMTSISENLGDYLEEQWIVDVYTVANEQLSYSSPLPFLSQFGSINTVYGECWLDIVSNKPENIQKLIDTVYAPQVEELMK